MFAPKGEKQLFKAIRAQDVKAMRQVGVDHPEFRLPAWSLAGLQLLTSEPTEATRMLDWVFSTGQDPAQNLFVAKYLHTELTLGIAPGVAAALPVNRDAVGLSLAELRQDAGDLPGAIDVVEQLEPTTYAAVSLAELYAQAQRWPDVIELSEGIRNEDDASALLLCYRGMAFRHQGFHDAAHESLNEALRARSRPVQIRHLALSERAENYLTQGKKALARRDLERILAEDSDYEGLRARLSAIA